MKIVDTDLSSDQNVSKQPRSKIINAHKKKGRADRNPRKIRKIQTSTPIERPDIAVATFEYFR